MTSATSTASVASMTLTVSFYQKILITVINIKIPLEFLKKTRQATIRNIMLLKKQGTSVQASSWAGLLSLGMPGVRNKFVSALDLISSLWC